VGHPDFEKHHQADGDATLVANTATFSLPLGAALANAEYTFTKILQFSPQGDATKLMDTPTRLIEVGLQATHGATIDQANAIAIHIIGISAGLKMYRQ
jgi:hypothetical protein